MKARYLRDLAGRWPPDLVFKISNVGANRHSLSLIPCADIVADVMLPKVVTYVSDHRNEKASSYLPPSRVSSLSVSTLLEIQHSSSHKRPPKIPP